MSGFTQIKARKTPGIVATTSFHRRVEIDVSHAHIFSPEPDIVEKRIEKFGRRACRESPLTAHAAHRQLSESSLIQYTDKNHYVRISTVALAGVDGGDGGHIIDR